MWGWIRKEPTCLACPENRIPIPLSKFLIAAVHHLDKQKYHVVRCYLLSYVHKMGCWLPLLNNGCTSHPHFKAAPGDQYLYKHFREISWNTFQIVWIYDDLWINTFYIHRSKLFWCEHFRGTGDPDHLDPSPYVPWSKHGIWFMVIQVIQPKTCASWIHVFNSYENGWLNPITEGLGISSNFCKTKVVYTIRFPWVSLFHP